MFRTDTTFCPGKEARDLTRARFLHTADLHLSRPFGFLPPQLAEERRRDQRIALTKIADIAIEREVDLVLIAGDLFDTRDPDPTDLEAVTKELTRLTGAGKRVYAIPGNHDYISSSSFWRQMPSCGVHVFTETEWDTVIVDDLGISVSGAAFHKTKSERRAFDGLSVPDDMPALVLAHGSYESFEGQLEKYHPFSAGELSSTRAAYVALGHYHRFNPISADGTTACYPGTPEGIGFDTPETDDRFVVVGEISDAGRAEIEPIKVNRRIVKCADIDCTSFDSQTSLFDAVRRLCEPSALVEVRLSGSPNAEIASVLDNLADRFRESCLYMNVDLSGLSLPSELPADDRTIRGRFCKYMLRQIEESSDPERKRLLRRSLDLGLAAFSEE